MKNLALIALSGIRIARQEILDFGMTFPGIVERSQLISSMPSLGLLILGALTPDSWIVKYFEIDDLDENPDFLGDFSPDLAAISTFTARAKDAYILSGRLRENGISTVFGGLHATCCPDESMNHFDSVVVGEGELSWGKVLADFEAGEMAPIYYPDEKGYQISESPTPAFGLLDKDLYNRITIQATRGCPWHCDFCAASMRLTKNYCRKPVELIVRDIENVKSIWKEPFVEFADDNTFVNKKWGVELCEALIPLELKWFTETDISVADDPALLKVLRKSGCRMVLVGIESPNADALNGIELVKNWKVDRHETFKESIAKIQQAGVKVNACFTLGLEGDGPEIFENVLEFVEEVKPYDVQITVMTPFPGTPLYDRLLKEDRILHPAGWEYCTLFDVNFKPKNMTVEQLEDGLLWLASHIYEEGVRQARHDAFFAQLPAV